MESSYDDRTALLSNEKQYVVKAINYDAELLDQVFKLINESVNIIFNIIGVDVEVDLHEACNGFDWLGQVDDSSPSQSIIASRLIIAVHQSPSQSIIASQSKILE